MTYFCTTDVLRESEAGLRCQAWHNQLHPIIGCLFTFVFLDRKRARTTAKKRHTTVARKSITLGGNLRAGREEMKGKLANRDPHTHGLHGRVRFRTLLVRLTGNRTVRKSSWAQGRRLLPWDSDIVSVHLFKQQELISFCSLVTVPDSFQLYFHWNCPLKHNLLVNDQKV